MRHADHPKDGQAGLRQAVVYCTTDLLTEREGELQQSVRQPLGVDVQ